MIRSEIAVYHRDSGELSHLAPANLAPAADDPALAFVALPEGYAEGLALCQWDSAARCMLPWIEGYRARQWEMVKAARARAEIWGCTTPHGRVDSDPESRLKISGAVQMAMLAQQAGQPFTIDWTMQDNSVAPHDAAAMLAMGLAVGEHIAACHAAALAKRNLIEAADTPEAIEAVDPDAGWPDAPAP